MKFTGLIIVAVFCLGGAYISANKTEIVPTVLILSKNVNASGKKDSYTVRFKLETSDASKPKESSCNWCYNAKTRLNYVLPTMHGKKICCSKTCLREYVKTYRDCRKKAYVKCDMNCGQCLGVIKGTPTQFKERDGSIKNLCSSDCLKKWINAHCKKSSEEHSLPAASGVFSNDIRAPRSRSRSSISGGVADLSISDVSPAFDRSNERSSNFQPPSFDWELYLKQTNSKAAPTDRFAQNEEPLKNRFKIGMKLKALDPRTLGATCIATVVDTVGPRLRLTLDGTAGDHDLWRLVDSDEIHPIDRFEASGDMSQPPLGFRHSPTYWPKFLSKILNGANVAPAEIFKCFPAKMPGKNMFKIGEKLEAVDKKNPHLIAVATVSDIEKEMIHITFDGWTGSFDYWCHYDSRDIFPAGWCLKNGYPLQPPGPHCNFVKPNNRFKSSTRNVLPAVAVSGSGVVAEPAVVLVGPAESSAPPAQPAAEPVISTTNNKPRVLDNLPVPKRFKSSTSNVLPAMAVSGSGVVAEPAQVLVSPAGSSVPSQSATEPDTTMDNGVSQVPNYDPEAGTSTLQSESPATRIVPKDPAEWTIEDVIHYIAINKPALAIHADIFREHEIDGKAFLLLDTESMMKIMGLKLGPALKIASLIDRIKEQST